VQDGRAGGQVAQVPGDRAGDVRAAVVGRDEAGAGRDRVGHLDAAGKRGPAVGDRDRVAQVVARGDRIRTVRLRDREIGRRVDAGRLGRRVVTRGRVGRGRGDRGRVREVGQTGRVDLDHHVQDGRAGGQVAQVPGDRAGDVRAAVVGRDEAGAGRDRVGHLDAAGK